MLLGCDSHNCHFGIDEKIADENYEKALGVMSLLGLKKIRLELVRLPHGDAQGFIRRMMDFVDQIDRLTPV
jgi:coenzyme F420-reducing hydrogenase delta subunit